MRPPPPAGEPAPASRSPVASGARRLAPVRQAHHGATAPRVVELAIAHRADMARHLRALSPEDRHLRFGFAPDHAAITRYVRAIDLSRDVALGIFDTDGTLAAFGHLALPPGGIAEFGLSVDATRRGGGLGAALLRRAADVAARHGARRLTLNYVPGNRALERMAARAGMQLRRVQGESVAELDLPEPEPEAPLALALEEALNTFSLAVLRLMTPPADATRPGAARITSA